MKEVFTLVLCNELDLTENGFCLNTTNNANATYQVNFDSLFQGKDKMYKKCQVRTSIVTNPVAVSALANTVGSIYISGLVSGNDLGTNGLFLTNITPSNANASGSSTGYYYNLNTLTVENGTQMNSVPTGVRVFSVNFCNVEGTLQANANIPDYRLVLQFELYDRV